MDALTNHELQLGILELDHAIYLHDQWFRNLLKVLIAHVPAELADLCVDAHLHCSFGKWLAGDAARLFDDRDEYVALQKAHEVVHSEARKLLQLSVNGLVIPPAEWDFFERCRETMRLSVLSARDRFAEVASNRDPLTEIQTRRGLLTELRKQQALVERGRQACALAMVDLDHFKKVNDTYGHVAGDVVLVDVVQCVKAHLRPYDRIYRYGGEEFIVCMPDTTVEQAGEIMDRLRLSIARLDFEFADIQVTASFGVAALAGSMPVEDAIGPADRAMYEAKAAGRNRVVLQR